MTRKNVLYHALFALYLAVLIYFLFFAEGFRENVTGEYRYNIVPFQEILRYLRYAKTIGYDRVVLNLAGNVIAFMPLGYFVPSIFNKRLGFGKMLLLGFVSTLSVELIQLVTKVGCCDVDDMMLNTLGAAMGYGLFALVHKKARKRK